MKVISRFLWYFPTLLGIKEVTKGAFIKGSNINLVGLTLKQGYLGTTISIGNDLCLFSIWNMISLWSFTSQSPKFNIDLSNLSIGCIPKKLKINLFIYLSINFC